MDVLVRIYKPDIMCDYCDHYATWHLKTTDVYYCGVCVRRVRLDDLQENE